MHCQLRDRSGSNEPSRKPSGVFVPLLIVCLVQGSFGPVGNVSGRSLLGQNAGEILTLEFRKPVQNVLSGGGKEVYRINLSQGQYAKIRIDQRGIDVVAHLIAPDGRLIADFDEAQIAKGREEVEIVAQREGAFRIEIEAAIPRADSGTYAIELLDLRQSSPTELKLDEARRQYYDALRLQADGQIDKAIELATHSLETRQSLLEPNHRHVAKTLFALGMIYVDKNDLANAESFLQRADDIFTRTSAIDSLDYANLLQELARVRFLKGDHAKSEELLLRALGICEKVAGPDSLPASISLLSLGTVYRAVNDLPRAEQMYLKVLAIRERLLGPNHSDVARVLNELGLLYYGAGDYLSAEKTLERSLTIVEKTFGPSHARFAQATNNLGLVAWKNRDYDKAATYFRRSMETYEKLFGPESGRYAIGLGNLGIIYKEGYHDYAKAEDCYLRALAIFKKTSGEFSRQVANSVASLGILYRDMGNYDRAEEFSLRALGIYERVSGPNNSYTVLVLMSLARLYAIKGDLERALEYQRRINAIEEKVIPLNLTIGSERQKLAYFRSLQKLDRVVTLQVGLGRNSAEARDLAATKVLQSKGRILDALSDNLSILKRRFDVPDRALLDNLREINSELATLVLGTAQKLSPEEQQKEIAVLENKREQIEQEISYRSAGFYQQSGLVTLAAVKEAVPPDAALLEFTVYRPFDWHIPDDSSPYGEPRYVVYVIRNHEEVKWVELGPAKDIDSLVGALRGRLRDPLRKDFQQIARALDEKIMQPVRALTGGAARLLVSADGELNLIPFEALVDEDGRYLIQKYSVTYLTSGRDLLRMQVARQSKAEPLVVADPSFGEASQERSKGGSRTVNTSNPGRSPVNALADVYFAALVGTTKEARTIQSLYPKATVLTGPKATESAVKATTAPILLHIATHGFFLEDEGSAINETREPGLREDKITNPLLRSGLALAGANRRSEGSDDGILTALEASGMNLWGTKLVTLSACDTGLGEVRDGEGVYGLRRAFVIAGAESLVMSLWPVSDYLTREIMTRYYRNLKVGMGRGAALRQVQLEIMSHKDQRHPFYWASFIQSGEWGNLNGKR